ncbi:Glutaredoxin-2 [Piscirickettsia salmonis]|uniref:Glutaredoxin family protein n=1 Tax=Piscirickettsia salmonis TaxID=1238 RepID=A0A1L6TB44_PISSA|nr:glutaredoxin 2 [Piscirickettsia salmonis]AKP73742.1 glutaredoxin [Piscirickettsia salmonis LF-89 = ATCC VR-1361]ALB22532.1 glutaredoxin family protein [Piscirickettsia salmonis]ALY02558.1 glutaredoxin [Piscirickettsia salmonis]AMA42099.1 glutaredoxin [Piscirickettsia salmonis]AOS34575.1 glutaredoxin [Piscirickettsia salmonis]
MTLYEYKYCPYCIRVRLALGLKNIPYEAVAVDYADSELPTRLIGKKMLPVLKTVAGDYLGESLDIVKYLDENHAGPAIIASARQAEIETILTKSRRAVYGLLAPRWLRAGFKELESQAAQDYLRHKFESSLECTLEESLANTAEYFEILKPVFAQLEALLTHTETVDGVISYADIVLVPPLVNLTLVKDIPLPDKLKQYLAHWAEQTGVDLYYNQAL